MNTLAAIRSAWRALRANMLRSLLTMLGIIIGVAAVITMIAVGQGATDRVQEYMKVLGSNIMLVLPGGAEPALVTRLNAALNKVLQRPAVREQFNKLGADTRESSASEYADFIRAEIARTARIVREAKITLD